MYETMNMLDEKTPMSGDALFSLELVVEKLFIPYAPCRFPAIAFRMLDFPTILIKHVEDDLGKAIRRKISFDPDYRLPNQFVELKDKNGNFMIKKGKSCLFKMGASVLKQHLNQTPLYVMVTDLFPEVPKLVGNSTVPLDSVMSSICVDIAKLGPTVPSVHGDKGLFKIYNLMGKEIGYFVLGFRLLCLGPSLIPHLPESALVHRQKKRLNKETKQVDQMLQESIDQETEEDEEPAVSLRNSACMTDPVKHDVLLQTVEMDDKAVHVAVSEIMEEKKVSQVQSVPKYASPRKESYQTTATQTEKKKTYKEVNNARKKWVEDVKSKVEDDDIIMNNIVCPPPLFYNSEVGPPLQIEKDHSFQTTDDDLSEIASFDGEGLIHKKQVRSEESIPDNVSEKASYYTPTDQRVLFDESQAQAPKLPKARPGEFLRGMQVVPQQNAIFPLLTALINELACIQDPQLLLDVSNKIQQRENKSQRNASKVVPVQKSEVKKDFDDVSPSVVEAVAAALARKMVDAKDTSAVGRQQQLAQGQASSVASKDQIAKGMQGKKTKLAFGMTNTQRLRLQKSNPAWLKEAEKNAEQTKSHKKTTTMVGNLDDVNATLFSDTLTEVRRLAERELESTAGGDTLRQVASEVEEMNSTFEQSIPQKRPMRPPVRVASGSPPRHSRKSAGRSSLSASGLQKAEKPKARPRMKNRRKSHQREAMRRDSSDSDDAAPVRRPVPLESLSRNITSPAPPDTPSAAYDEDLLSARSESRSRSIEVHLPSVQADGGQSDTITDTEDDDVDIPLPDDSLVGSRSAQGVNLPQYISRDTSLPDSIEGVPNASLNVTGAVDDNSPLESTRHSRNLTEEQNDSRILQSTDYDTKQFHSTDEPELQGLMSEDENRSEISRRSLASVRTSQKFPVINPQLSENSPVPSVRRSMTKQELNANSYLPSMSASKLSSPGSSRPGTPKGQRNKGKGLELQAINTRGGVITPRSNRTPRSASPSPKHPILAHGKRPLRDFRESIHTESLSSYVPSDPENLFVSLSSNSGNYSDDFLPDSGDANSAVEQLPKILSNAKKGYTIN